MTIQKEIAHILVVTVKVTVAITVMGAIGYAIVGVIWFGFLK